MQSCDYSPNLVHLPVSPLKLDFLFLEYFRKSSASKTAPNGTQSLSRTSASLVGGNEVGKNLEGAVENEDSLIPMKMPNSFIDAKVLQAREPICCVRHLPSIHLLFICKILSKKLHVKCIISILHIMKCEAV